MNTRNFPFRISLWAMLVMASIVLSSAPQAWGKPAVRKIGNRLWIPNTTIKLTPQASALALTDTSVWCALTGGLGEYNLQNGRETLYYMGDDDGAADITSLAAVDDTLWVATRKGIRLFNMHEKTFTATLTSQNSPLGADNNISLTFDGVERMLYIMSFENIQRYDVKKKKWELLNYLYTEKGVGEPGGNPTCLAGDDDVWIASPAHASSKGALFRYSRKDKSWTSYRDQVSGIKNTKRLDIDDMMLGPGRLFVALNDRLGCFDEKLSRWDLFNGQDLETPGMQCAEGYPHLVGRYEKSKHTVAGMLSRYLAPHVKFHDYTEIYFLGEKSVGLTAESLFIMGGEDRSAVSPLPIRFAQAPLHFTRALSTDSLSRVLFVTNHGLEVLDTQSMELSTIKNSESLADRSEFCDYQALWRDDFIFLVVRRLPEPEGDPASRSARIYTIDTKKWQLQNRTPRDVHWVDELFVTKNNLYCYTDKSLMIWKGDLWVPTKEKVMWSASPMQPPSRRALFTFRNGRKVELTPRGVMVYER